MSYRPSGVIVLGIFMIIVAIFNIFWGVIELPLLGTSSAMFLIGFSTFPELLFLILMFVAGGMLLVGAVGLLSMTSWGYYTALVSSVVLVIDSVLTFIIGFLSVTIGFAFIMFIISAIFGLILGIVIITYLRTNVKYYYPISVNKEVRDSKARGKTLSIVIAVLFLLILTIRLLTYVQHQNPYSLYSPLWGLIFVSLDPSWLIPQLLFNFYDAQQNLQKPNTQAWYGIVAIAFWVGLFLVSLAYSRWRAKKTRAGAF